MERALEREACEDLPLRKDLTSTLQLPGAESHALHGFRSPKGLETARNGSKRPGFAQAIRLSAHPKQARTPYRAAWDAQLGHRSSVEGMKSISYSY